MTRTKGGSEAKAALIARRRRTDEEVGSIHCGTWEIGSRKLLSGTRGQRGYAEESSVDGTCVLWGFYALLTLVLI